MFGLGHGKAAANIAGCQRAEIAILLVRAAVRQQHFHVADIRRLAVEGKVAKRRAPEFFAHLRKVAERQSQSAVRFRQGRDPQPLCAHLTPQGLQLGKYSSKSLPQKRGFQRYQILGNNGADCGKQTGQVRRTHVQLPS